MWVITLVVVVIWANRWMHKHDRLLYTKEEIAQLQREAAERESRLVPAHESLEADHPLLGRPER